MKIKRHVKILISLLVIFSNIGCDQITKEKVREEISLNETIEVIGRNFILTKVENTGAALSLGENLSPKLKVFVLQILPILALVFMFIYIIKNREVTRSYLIGFSFIIGGGIGNIYDRILFNSVTDFMYFEYGYLHTGIFNMADVSVVIGTIIILINSIKTKKNKLKSFGFYGTTKI